MRRGLRKEDGKEIGGVQGLPQPRSERVSALGELLNQSGLFEEPVPPGVSLPWLPPALSLGWEQQREAYPGRSRHNRRSRPLAVLLWQIRSTALLLP